jgi:hypothetical protein
VDKIWSTWAWLSLSIKKVGIRCVRRTQRAADLGYAPRYFDIFLAWSFSRFDRESTLPPQAANASRWASRRMNFKIKICLAGDCPCSAFRFGGAGPRGLSAQV